MNIILTEDKFMSMPVIPTLGPSREQAESDIIASIALMEAALAHVLNAEGEKIQAVLGTLSGADPALKATNIPDLLKINSSVNSTITEISSLEGLLISKLSFVITKANSSDDSDDD